MLFAVLPPSLERGCQIVRGFVWLAGCCGRADVRACMLIERSPVLRFLGVRKVPLKYKVKTEDQRKEDFNIIRHNAVTV